MGDLSAARGVVKGATRALSAPAPGVGDEGSHHVMDGFAAAARHCRLRVAVVALPPARYLRRRPGPPGRAQARLRSVEQHLRLPGAVRAQAGADLVVVREFLTLPLLLAAPRLRAQRRRIALVLAHNLQQARRPQPYRVVLRALRRGGCGFCCLESDAGFAEVMAPRGDEAPLVLPHVVTGEAACPPAPRGGGRPRVGVVGASRPEKNTGSLLERLLALRDGGALEAELLLGSPEPGQLARWARRVDAAVDTRSPAAYAEALRRCDLVAFDYAEPRYRLRSSGVVTEAVAEGCAVVCPDFPLLRTQVTRPRPVGALFRSPDDLLPAIRRALAVRRDDPGAFLAYRRARSPRAVAERLDGWARARLDRPSSR